MESGNAVGSRPGDYGGQRAGQVYLGIRLCTRFPTGHTLTAPLLSRKICTARFR